MLEELRRFILVAKSGNVSKTAESIFITQSALSQSIKRLEKELGTKLFVQKGKTLQITTEGKAIVEIGTKILELWEKAKNPKSLTTQKSTIALGLFDSAALKLGKYIAANKTSNSFTLELTISGSSKLLSQLQLGTIDIAICVIDNKNPEPKNLILVKSFTEELIPVIGKQLKEKLEKIPFIAYNSGSHTRIQIDDIFKNHKMTPLIFAESTSVSFMKRLAVLGSGVALLPKNYIEIEMKQGELKKQKLPFIVTRKFGIYIQKNSGLTKDDKVIKELTKNLG